MAKYRVLVDYEGTIEYIVDSDSFENAYRKVVNEHQALETVPRNTVYMENFYVEDEDGIMEDF